MVTVWVRAALVALLVAGAVVVAGCGQQAGEPKGPPKDRNKDKGGKPTTHGEWWCDEHGVPEAECSMCDDKVFAKCKAAGDVCPNHPDRAKSQCFICDASLWDKSKVRYTDHYKGKEAPEPKDNMPGKK
ncbi:MAG: hypothetical protein K2V38_16960 [Gemmataceae bacterium]|nr:hypothetical protein [Gemmataceae bacterium]